VGFFTVVLRVLLPVLMLWWWWWLWFPISGAAAVQSGLIFRR
jgi:hypothetical protein